nr:response regulator [Pontixanthobacter luteolus]
MAPATPTPVDSATETARHCLLVDDSRMIRKIARQIIEARGYAVAEAENGEEALAKCGASMPDLIMLDWDMPIMTGIEFLAKLRAVESAKQPKVVFCTTHSSAMDIHKAIDVGADEFVTKPFTEESLLAKLRNIGAA